MTNVTVCGGEECDIIQREISPHQRGESESVTVLSQEVFGTHGLYSNHKCFLVALLLWQNCFQTVSYCLLGLLLLSIYFTGTRESSIFVL